MKTFLVAGGAGFIGRHLCTAILDRGDRVICLDNFLSSQPQDLARLRTHERFSLIECDVAEAPAVDCDVVFHLASPASPLDYQLLPIETMLANALGTHRLSQVALGAGAKFILASTSEVYGDPLEHPQTETYWGNVNPVGPRACYDESKRFAEALALEYHRQRGLPVLIARIFNTYGPGMRWDDGRAIPAFFEAALNGRPLPLHGDGLQTRSLCYVADTVAGLLAVADSECAGEIFNVGNPTEVSIRDLALRVCAALGVPNEVQAASAAVDDPRRRRPDISKIQRVLGWSPKVSLEDGLALTAADFRARLQQIRRVDVPP